jgi:DNA-binding MarR family transcriptional regulator
MKYRRVGLKDIGSQILHHFPKKNNKYRRGRFLQLNQDKVIEICSNKRYSGSIMRVFYYFHGVVEYGNRIPYLSQSAISKILKMSQPDVSNAIKILEEDRIIFKKQPYKDYYFSEDLLVKGNSYYEN